MQRGKYKCKQLKALRKRIADENGIPLKQKECTYDGPCRGTCPYCESEMRYLERALADRLRLGRVATVAGLSLGLAACGGQTPGGTPMLTTDSTLAADSLTDSLRDTLPSGLRHSGPDVISVTNVGELEVIGDVIDVPPPPPPEHPDDEMILGRMDEPIYEGEVDDDVEADYVCVLVENDPSFPGGMEAMYKFLAENIKYPQEAKDNNISGKVYVTFVVETDGRITNPRLLRDIGGGCGQEAIRVVKSMPRWNPGKNNGQPARVQFNLPVNFTLTDE
ncbi:MAG: energy transducer TonB [Bacteroidales bacterium]|nr:energy transducer TonB [Bacteroidales bacterium]